MGAMRATLKDVKLGWHLRLAKRVQETRGIRAVHLFVELRSVDEAWVGVLCNVVDRGNDVVKFVTCAGPVSEVIDQDPGMSRVAVKRA